MVHLAHALRSPLSGVRAALELAKRDPKAAMRDGHLLDDTLGLVDYSLMMVNNLLLLAEVEESPPRMVARRGETRAVRPFEDILFGIVSVLGIYVRASGITIRTLFDPRAFPDTLALTASEELYLRSAFFNLLSNAIKYGAVGSAPDVQVRGRMEADSIVFEIVDRGIGVPEGEEELIFRKGRRGSNAESSSPPGGSGLGLYISRALVNRLGGRLSVASRARPTIFRMELPLRFGGGD
jgi:signal transduction histidine kinase